MKLFQSLKFVIFVTNTFCTSQFGLFLILHKQLKFKLKLNKSFIVPDAIMSKDSFYSIFVITTTMDPSLLLAVLKKLEIAECALLKI